MITGHYIRVQGIKTYYELSDAGPSSPATVVCLHSAGQSTSQWHYTMDELFDRGVTSVAVDLPAHGKSARHPEGPVEDLEVYARFVHAFVADLGIERPVVTGCSIGGCTTLQIAVLFGAELHAVVAAAATDHNPTVPRTGLDLARADAGIPGWPDRAAAYAAAATGDRCPDDRRDELAWQHRCGDPKIANADLRGWNAHDVRGRLGDVVCPLAIVVGEEDFYIPRERVAALQEELGVGRVAVVPGIGHYPMVEWDGFTDFLVEHAHLGVTSPPVAG